jgi:hypothetical protein
MISPPVHLTQLPGKGTRASKCPGLTDADKHRLLQVLGSVGPKHRPRWDVAVGTHTPLALRTRVGNLFHRRPTSLCLGNMPKQHHDTTWR